MPTKVVHCGNDESDEEKDAVPSLDVPKKAMTSGFKPKRKTLARFFSTSEVRDRRASLSPRSKAYDAGGKGFLTMEENLMRELDVDGDGELSKDEFVAAAKRLMEEKKNAARWRSVGIMSMLLLFVLGGMMLGITLVANEASKDTRPTEGSAEMRTVGSNDVVRTGSVESFGKLFDLPHFDTQTLSKMEYLTIQLGGVATNTSTSKKWMGTFHIASAMKQVGTLTATFLTTDGSSIVVDGTNVIAYAQVQGKRYFVDDVDLMEERRRLLKAGTPYTPRLYAEHEFFTDEHGFEVTVTPDGTQRRRLTEENSPQGYAAFAISAASQVMDAYEEQDGVDYETMFFTGGFYSEGSESAHTTVDVYYVQNPTSTKNSRVVITQGTFSNTQDKALGYFFTRNEGKLVGCHALDEEAAKESSELTFAAGGGMMFKSEDNGDYFVIESDILFDADADAAIPAIPSGDECRLAAAEARASGGGRRLESRLLGESNVLGGGFSAHKLWKAAYSAYVGEDIASHGWTLATNCPNTGEPGNKCICKRDNSHGVLLKSGSKYVLSFSGTDGISDFQDWKDNLNTGERKMHGKRVHGGFLSHMEKLQSCAQGMVSGKTITHIVGHSLGGAVSMMFTQNTGVTPTNGLVTFGAPMTHYDECGSVHGMRYYHEKDPVTSDFLGIMGGLKHNIGQAKILREKTPCNKYLKLWWCKNIRCSGCSGCSGCSWRGCSGCSGCSGCTSNCGWHSTGQCIGWGSYYVVENANKCSGKGDCPNTHWGGSIWDKFVEAVKTVGNGVKCAYNFATYHGEYGPYL